MALFKLRWWPIVFVLLCFTRMVGLAQEDASPRPFFSGYPGYMGEEWFSWSVDEQSLTFASTNEMTSHLDDAWWYRYDTKTGLITFYGDENPIEPLELSEAEKTKFDMAFPLSVSPNGRYVVYAENSPIYYYVEGGDRAFYRLRIGNRQTFQHSVIISEYKDGQTVKKASREITTTGATDVIWSADSQAFILRTQPLWASYEPPLEFVHHYTDDVAQVKAQFLNDGIEIGDEVYYYPTLFDISNDHSCVLLLGFSRNQEISENGHIILWYPDTPSRSRIIGQPIYSSDVPAGSFAKGSTDKIHLITKAGLVEYTVSVDSWKILDPLFHPLEDRWEDKFIFSPSGEWLVFKNPGSENYGQGIYLYNNVTQQFSAGVEPASVTQIPNDDLQISTLNIIWSADSQWLAAPGDEGGIWLYYSDDLEQAPNFLSTGSEVVKSLAFSEDSSMLAAGTKEGSVWLWPDRTRDVPVSIYQYDGEEVDFVAFSYDNQFLVFDGGNKVRLWDFKDEHEQIIAWGDNRDSAAGVFDAVFQPDGTLRFSYSGGQFNLRTDLQVKFVPVERSCFGSDLRAGFMVCPVYNRDGTRDLDLSIKLINFERYPGDYLWIRPAPFDYSNAVFDPLGRYAAMVRGYSGYSSTIWFWDLIQSGRPILFDTSGGLAAGLAFSPDGTRLASVTWGGELRIWEVPDHLFE